MSETIWKYQLRIADKQEVEIPELSIFAHLEKDPVLPGTINVWMLVVPESRMVMKVFRFYGTGHPISQELQEYLGTVREGGVWHLFVDEVNCVRGVG